MFRSAALAALALLVVACGQQQPVARTSPSPSTAPATPSPTAAPSAGPSPSPSPLAQAYGILATPPYSAAGPQTTYALSIVGADGKIAASTTAATRSGLQCTSGQVNAAVVLPSETLSATNDRVYYLDGNTNVKWMAPDGSHGTSNPVPGGGSVGSTFAVSPDDRRIAVVSADYSQNPIPYRIYVEDVAGGDRVQIFNSTTSNLLPWAMGWHDGKLVLGYAPSCTQGGGPFSAFPHEIHLVDPGTAVRSATLGGGTCPVVSLPSPTGAICLQQSGAYSIVQWDGSAKQAVDFGSEQASSLALSPGGVAAACCTSSGGILIASGGNTHAGPSGGAQSLGFIDDGHLVLGSDNQQQQPRIYSVVGGDLLSMSTLGDFLGRIPGAL